jgi:urease subunit gamma/beta
MRLTPWEEERLQIFSAAELARRHRSVGLRLNQPEAVALICDAMLEAARAGATYPEVEAAGRAAVRPDELMDGVRALVDEVRLEVLLGDGTRLVVLVDPLGPDDPLAAPAGTPRTGSASPTDPGPGAGPASTGGGRA